MMFSLFLVTYRFYRYVFYITFLANSCKKIHIFKNPTNNVMQLKWYIYIYDLTFSSLLFVIYSYSTVWLSSTESSSSCRSASQCRARLARCLWRTRCRVRQVLWAFRCRCRYGPGSSDQRRRCPRTPNIRVSKRSTCQYICIYISFSLMV